MGIGKKLLQNIENVAIGKKHKILYVNSSLTAFTFYQSQGYQKIKKSGFLTDLRIWIPTILLKKQLIPFTRWEKLPIAVTNILLIIIILLMIVLFIMIVIIFLHD